MKFTRGVRKGEDSRPTWKDKRYCIHFQTCLQGKTAKEEINDTSLWYYVFLGGLSHRSLGLSPSPHGSVPRGGGSPTSQPVWPYGLFWACLLFCCINAPLRGWFPEVQVEPTASWGLGPACLGSQGLDDEWTRDLIRARKVSSRTRTETPGPAYSELATVESLVWEGETWDSCTFLSPREEACLPLKSA